MQKHNKEVKCIVNTQILKTKETLQHIYCVPRVDKIYIVANFLAAGHLYLYRNNTGNIFHLAHLHMPFVSFPCLGHSLLSHYAYLTER